MPKNEFEKWIEEEPKFAELLSKMGQDPTTQQVDDAIFYWMSSNRDKIFEYSQKERDKLIEVVKESYNYRHLIAESLFFQYVQVRMRFIYEGLLRTHQQPDGYITGKALLGILEILMEDVLAVGYALRKLEKKPPRKKDGK